jgi:hypothetical protein
MPAEQLIQPFYLGEGSIDSCVQFVGSLPTSHDFDDCAHHQPAATDFLVFRLQAPPGQCR